MESITVQKNDNRLATFWQSIHHLNMRLRILLVSVLFTASAWAGIVDNVRIALSQNNFSAAESALNAYRNQRGVTPEYLEAYSWMARAALDQGQYEQAAAYAKQTQTLAVEQMKRRPLDCRSASADCVRRGDRSPVASVGRSAGSGPKPSRCCRPRCRLMGRLPFTTGYRRT